MSTPSTDSPALSLSPAKSQRRRSQLPFRICAISPTTVTPPASASATITTTLQTTTLGYSITITGTATPPYRHPHHAAQNLTVLAVTPQFTITVTSSIVPKSIPAGNGAEGTILINPINGYSTP